MALVVEGQTVSAFTRRSTALASDAINILQVRVLNLLRCMAQIAWKGAGSDTDAQWEIIQTDANNFERARTRFEGLFTEDDDRPLWTVGSELQGKVMWRRWIAASACSRFIPSVLSGPVIV